MIEDQGLLRWEVRFLLLLPPFGVSHANALGRVWIEIKQSKHEFDATDLKLLVR